MTNWPKITELERFYGKIHVNQEGLPSPQWEASHLVNLRLTRPLRCGWDPEQAVHKIRCHRDCRGPISAIFEAIIGYYNGDQRRIQESGTDLFGGCYHFDIVDGRPSAHAYGAAIRLLCEPNDDVIEIFERNGAKLYGGSFVFADVSEAAAISPMEIVQSKPTPAERMAHARAVRAAKLALEKVA